MDYFSIAGVKIGTKKYEISSPHPTQLLPERDHALLLRPFQPVQIKNIRIDGFKYRLDSIAVSPFVDWLNLSNTIRCKSK